MKIKINWDNKKECKIYNISCQHIFFFVLLDQFTGVKGLRYFRISSANIASVNLCRVFLNVSQPCIWKGQTVVFVSRILSDVCFALRTIWIVNEPVATNLLKLISAYYAWPIAKKLLVEIQSLHQCGERKTNLLFQSWELAIIMTHRQKLMDPYRVCRRESSAMQSRHRSRELGKNAVWDWQERKQWLFSFHRAYMFNVLRLTLNCVLFERTLSTQWLSRFLDALKISYDTGYDIYSWPTTIVWLFLKGGLESPRNKPILIFGSSRDRRTML